MGVLLSAVLTAALASVRLPVQQSAEGSDCAACAGMSTVLVPPSPTRPSLPRRLHMRPAPLIASEICDPTSSSIGLPTDLPGLGIELPMKQSSTFTCLFKLKFKLKPECHQLFLKRVWSQTLTSEVHASAVAECHGDANFHRCNPLDIVPRHSHGEITSG